MPEVTGLLVEPESPEALAGAIARLIAAPELRARFGQAGQRRVAADFSAERMTADYLRVYREALAVRAGGRVGSVGQGPHG